MAAALLFSTVALAQPLEEVSIKTRTGDVTFQVELAETAAERAKGLMYRTELAPGTGMLFDFGVEQPVSMWMKNTYIPLDMIFIRADGRIARIAVNTVPLSTQTIDSGAPVKAVLEIAGGEAAKAGLTVGDRVTHRMFSGR